MTHLKFVETGEAEGLVKEVYEAMSQGAAGQVPPLMQTLSLNPEGLAGFEKFYHAISAGGSTLGRRREEMIATAVSAWNGCWYWMVHHGEYLRAITRDDLLIWHLEHDDSQAGLDPQERAMLDFARKLNDEPSKMDAEDIQQLRSVGFDDRGALDIVMVISVFNLLNRWADAVGVTPLEHLLRAKERGDRRAQEQLQGPLAAAGK